MTYIPEFMNPENVDTENLNEEQIEWLKHKATELKHYYYQIAPTLKTAWGIMSTLQEIVDINKEWADGLQINDLDTAYIYLYAEGTLELVKEQEEIKNNE